MINFSTFSFAIIPCAPDNSEFIANNADCFFPLLLNLTIFYLDDDWFKEQKQKIKKFKKKRKKLNKVIKISHILLNTTNVTS